MRFLSLVEMTNGTFNIVINTSKQEKKHKNLYTSNFLASKAIVVTD